MLVARAVWEADRRAQRSGVETPHALEQKYPKVGHLQTGVSSHLAPFICHTPATSRDRYSHRARTARSLGCFNHHDLHARAQGGRGRHGQPAGCAELRRVM